MVNGSPCYEIRECTADACTLRFPMPCGQWPGEQCPACGAPTIVVQTLVNRTQSEIQRQGFAQREPLPLLALVDNVRSLFNVGSIFRSADGAGFAQIHLCGITPTPENPKLAKTALGAELAVPWCYHRNNLHAVDALRQQGHVIWALEEDVNAEALFAASLPDAPLVLVVGNEVTGIDPALLKRADRVVALPMRGTKRSLNVATAFGAAAVILAERYVNSILPLNSDKIDPIVQN